MMSTVRRSVFAVVALALALMPWWVEAQTPPPGQGQMVVVMSFSGEATESLRRDAETAVRNALAARGAQVPDRMTVEQAVGVNPPTDPPSIVRFARAMGATHVVTGTVLPFAGQYTLELTVYDVATGRPGTRRANIGDTDAGPAVSSLITALFAPGALNGPAVSTATPVTPPPDPEAARAAAAERQRQAAAQAAEAERQRQAAAASARQTQTDWDTAHPVRAYSAGGPFALGAMLSLGDVVSGVRAAPSGVLAGGAPAGSSLAFAVRAEGTYALDAVPGLELAGGISFLTTPTSAVGLGVGAQYNLPARSRGRWRMTGGALVGVFQGISGARITSAWVSPYVRGEYQIVSQIAAFVGAGMDIIPGSNGGFTALSVLAGARIRLGGGTDGTNTAATASP